MHASIVAPCRLTVYRNWNLDRIWAAYTPSLESYDLSMIAVFVISPNVASWSSLFTIARGFLEMRIAGIRNARFDVQKYFCTDSRNFETRRQPYSIRRS